MCDHSHNLFAYPLTASYECWVFVSLQWWNLMSLSCGGSASTQSVKLIQPWIMGGQIRSLNELRGEL